MIGQVGDVLDTVDTERLRNSVAVMRTTVADVCTAGSPIWPGRWQQLAETLREVGRVDLCLARLVEGHADAMRILDQAGQARRDGVYGVWASRSEGTGLRAAEYADGWSLSGQLRFASGVDLIDRALVTAWVDRDHHLLFDIGVEALPVVGASWAAAGMDASRSFTLGFDAVPTSTVVGPVDFYLDRPGFAVGGLGPAAVWLGGCVQIVDLVADGLRGFAASSHQLHRLGRMAQAAWTAEAAMSAAVCANQEPSDDLAEAVAAARTAAVLASDTALAEAPVIVGPAGLTRSARLAHTLADLGVYVRQHHLDAELAAAGQRALTSRKVLGK